MFAAHEVMVDAPYEDALVRLTHLINWGRLNSISDATYQGGLDLLVRVGPFGDVPLLSKLVRVRALTPSGTAATRTISFRWEATGIGEDLFPVLDADLVLSRAEADRCRLRLVGSYRPPLGRAGAVIDQAVMGRVATATIRSLVERVAVALLPPAPEAQTHRPLTTRPEVIPET